MRKILPLLTLSAVLSACGTQTAPLVTSAAPSATSSLSAQIVGGTVSARGARPYQVALLKPQFFCGGTLIAPNWVLTAAHCADGTSAGALTVRAGVNRLSSTEGQRLAVSAIYIHPNWNGNEGHGADLALLKLSGPVTDPYAAPARLPSNATESVLDVAGNFAVVSGWGKVLGSSSAASDTLREVSLPITPNPVTCGGQATPGKTICGEVYQGKDSCDGDSGGPLAQTDGGQSGGQFYVLGIVSYGPKACTGYGVYTRVNGYLDWIKQVSGVTPDSITAPTTTPPTPTTPTTPATTTKTYSGSVGLWLSSYQPSSGFSFGGGAIKGVLSAGSGTNFNLYLQKQGSLGSWSDVASSANPGSNETLSATAGAGVYRWRVFASSGSGSYTLTETR